MREIVNLNVKWAFSKEASKVPSTMPENWYWVTLPHTWNDIDGQDGGNDLYRGTCYYAKEIIKADLPVADKYYLEFCGANSSADVYVDGNRIGEIGNVVMRERKIMSNDGIVVVIANIDTQNKIGEFRNHDSKSKKNFS